MNTYDNKYLICPYCGYKEEVDFETFYSTDLDCDEEHECEECGETFIASRYVFFTYETFPKVEKKP